MKKRVIIFGLMVICSYMFSQELVNESTGTNNSWDQSVFINTVSEITPLDMPLDPEEYIIDAGDVFIIQLISTSTITYQLQVGYSGVLSIPGYGQVDVSGETLQSSINLIEKLCKSKSKNLTVTVNLNDVKKLKIPVNGAVENPGMITLPASSRLSEYLSKSQMNYLAKDFQIEIRSANDTVIVDINEYLVKGDMESNPYLKAGEAIFVPFADIATECIEVYGPVNTKSLIPIMPNENLKDFYFRKIKFSNYSDYSGVTIINKNDKSFQKTISADALQSYTLKAGDVLEFARLQGVEVNGYVNNPGSYDFIPGNTVYDYVAMAGGVDPRGNLNKTMIVRGNEKIRNIKDFEVKRGDIVLVRRSIEDVMIGQISLLQFIASIASITTAFIAAYNSIGA